MTGILRLLAALGLVVLLGWWPTAAHADEVIGLPGEQKDGSSDAADPTEVEAGSWQDTLGKTGSDDEVLYYRYRRTMEFSTVHMSVMASTDDPEKSGGIGFAVTTPSGDECTSTSEIAPSEGGYFVALDRDGVDPGDDPSLCNDSDVLIIAVDHGYLADGESAPAMPFALTIVEEARVKKASDLPASGDMTEWKAPDVSGDAEENGGASSFADAEVVDPGAYRGTLMTGETRVYAVEVGWGQTVQTRAVANRVTGLPEDMMTGPDFGVGVVDPVFRSRFSGDYAFLSKTDPETATAVAGPVRYLDRVDGEAPFLPGTYYVVVGTTSMEEGDPVKVDYTLEIGVAGDETGAPDYGTDEPFVSAGGSGDMVESVGGGLSLLRIAGVAVLTLLGLGGVGGGGLLLARR